MVEWLMWKSTSPGLSQKHSTQKRADGVAEVAEYLPSNCDALSSNPNATKKKEREIKIRWKTRVVVEK
jgi:hypothetical protein